MNDLKEKTFILTGASMGIGHALALELARSGVDLVLNARHSAPLEKVAARCEELGSRVCLIPGSAALADTVRQLVDAALSLGRFHGFIQAAGVLHPGPFLWELSENRFAEVFEASVMASFQLIRFAAPDLLKQGRGIAVFFGSGASERHTTGIGAYSAAKAAEEHLARQLAVEAQVITSFIYRPGVVETRMQEQARESEGGAAPEVHRIFQGFRERGELLSPEEAAKALVRILGDNPRRFHGRVATWRDGVLEEMPDVPE